MLRGHTDVVFSVHITRDGRKYISGAGDGTARVWNAAAPNAGALKVLQHDDGVGSVCTARGDTIIVTGCLDGTVWLWEMATGARMKTFAIHADWVVGVCATPDGKRIASCSADGSVRFTDFDDTGRVLIGAMPPAATSVGAACRELQVKEQQQEKTDVAACHSGSGSGVELRQRRQKSEALCLGAASFGAKGSVGAISLQNESRVRELVDGTRK